MNAHTLQQSVSALSKALAPLAGTHRNAKNGAAEASTDAAKSGHPTLVSQPFSCMSSGRAKAGDVAAARRYYADSR